MIYRWWEDLVNQECDTSEINFYLNNHAARVTLEENPDGFVCWGKGTHISKDAIIKGNVIIGEDCMIGTGAILRGNVRIQNNVRIGYGVEVKDSVIKENTTIGPLCYLGNSLIEQNVYLGALVRTSNHRLDRASIKSWNGECYENTGFEKLGAWIKDHASLGVGVVILPGRIVPENSTFSPNIVITKNYSPGTYMLTQNISKID